jgi:hypothetical protein
MTEESVKEKFDSGLAKDYIHTHIEKLSKKDLITIARMVDSFDIPGLPETTKKIHYSKIGATFDINLLNDKQVNQLFNIVSSKIKINKI